MKPWEFKRGILVVFSPVRAVHCSVDAAQEPRAYARGFNLFAPPALRRQATKRFGRYSIAIGRIAVPATVPRSALVIAT